MPRNGRVRIAVRLEFPKRLLDENTGELLYEEIKDDDGNVIQPRAPRRVRRAIAFGTRRRNDGRQSGELPRNIRLWRERMAGAVA